MLPCFCKTMVANARSDCQWQFLSSKPVCFHLKYCCCRRCRCCPTIPCQFPSTSVLSASELPKSDRTYNSVISAACAAYYGHWSRAPSLLPIMRMAARGLQLVGASGRRSTACCPSDAKRLQCQEMRVLRRYSLRGEGTRNV
ncbi:unnamed protein product [Polarella glacialis]|uniref:Uncharacterized protein n=1 Tax=Polarella glacialis TaxID=89957 RepID=A0A813FLL7_POLGL|nr:unnamed protein product [Polarella glacialis]